MQTFISFDSNTKSFEHKTRCQSKNTICAQMITPWSEFVEGELRKIFEMNRLQLPEYANRVRSLGWFQLMAAKWLISSHNLGDDLRNDVNKIHSSLQSRLNGKHFFLWFFV